MNEPIVPPAPSGETDAQLNLAGHAVSPHAGLAWWTKAWPLFTRRPGMWIAVAVVTFVLVVVVSFIPLIGQLAVLLFGPVIAGGLMLGVRDVDRGNPLSIAHIFAGFSNNMGQLVRVGVIYLVGMVLAAAITALVAGVNLVTVTAVGPTGIALAGLVMLALSLPLYMAIWFAPALVVYHGIGAVDAMKASFSGCLKNVVPFLIYGIVGLVLSIVASIPFGLGWLVVGPMAAASVYNGYRDIYLGVKN